MARAHADDVLRGHAGAVSEYGVLCVGASAKGYVEVHR